MINRQRILFRQFFPLFLVILIAVTARTGQAEDTFELGNQAYAQGNYSTAVQHYLSTAGSRGVSAPLLYNLANAYAKMGKTGEAIRAYEQALRLDHGNGNIRSNLAAIRKKNGIYQQDKSIWEQFANLLDADQWMLLSGLFFFIFSCCLLARSLRGNNDILTIKDSVSRIAGYTIPVAFLATLITLPAAVYGYQSWNDGVVLTDSRLLISPFTTAASAGTIREGRIVRPIKQHNQYVLVLDRNGQKGWLDRSHIGLIRELPGENRVNNSQTP